MASPDGPGPSAGCRFHPAAWCLWLVSALVPAALTRHPAYLGLLVLVLAAVFFGLGRRPAHEPGWEGFLRFGLILVVFSSLVQPLLVHQGATTLFSLPRWRWDLEIADRQVGLLDLGGRVTAESVATGFLSGLALLAVLLAFAAFQRAVDPVDLVRRMPRFLHQSSVVLSIALTFIPQTLVAQREIREAQALRGVRQRGLRGLAPTFVTLLAEGLERSLNLAEAMEARGFGGVQAHRPPAWAGWAIAGGLLTVLGAIVVWPWLWLPGLVLLTLAVRRIGAGVRRTRFRRLPWTPWDTALVAACSASVVALVLNRQGLAFTAYPRLAWPAVQLLPILAILLLALPLGDISSERGRGP